MLSATIIVHAEVAQFEHGRRLSRRLVGRRRTRRIRAAARRRVAPAGSPAVIASSSVVGCEAVRARQVEHLYRRCREGPVNELPCALP